VGACWKQMQPALQQMLWRTMRACTSEVQTSTFAKPVPPLWVAYARITQTRADGILPLLPLSENAQAANNLGRADGVVSCMRYALGTEQYDGGRGLAVAPTDREVETTANKSLEICKRKPLSGILSGTEHSEHLCHFTYDYVVRQPLLIRAGWVNQRGKRIDSFTPSAPK
jgi:hypothetical protein